MPTPRFDTDLSGVVGSKLYVAGGLDTAITDDDQYYVADVWVYDVLEVFDPSTSSWSSAPPLVTFMACVQR